MRRPITPARLILLLALALPFIAGPHYATAVAHPPPPTPATAFSDCEGDACSSVTLTFDEEKQQYRVQNNSADRWVKVSASNLAAATSACVAPGRDEYLPLKSVVAPYKAAYSEARCGAPAGVG